MGQILLESDGGLRVDLLVNFGSATLKQGLRRVVNNYKPREARSARELGAAREAGTARVVRGARAP